MTHDDGRDAAAVEDQLKDILINILTFRLGGEVLITAEDITNSVETILSTRVVLTTQNNISTLVVRTILNK